MKKTIKYRYLSLILFATMVIFGVIGCGGSEAVKKSNEVKIYYSNTEDQLILEAQQELLQRVDFDRTVLSYDTTNLINSDSLPWRLLSKERLNRIPKKKKIAGYVMDRGFNGYKYRDKDWRIESRYPGVVAYFPSGWGDYAKKLEHYDQAGTLLRTLDFDKLSPYHSVLSNVSPGSFNFETMSYDVQYKNENYIKEAATFLEDRSLIIQRATNWTIVNYRLIAFNEKKDIIGYETILKVYDEFGIEQYAQKLPYNSTYEFLSNDNQFLVFAPSRAEYMPNAYKDNADIVVIDLNLKREVFRKTFDLDANQPSIAYTENLKENVLGIGYSNQRLKRDNKNFIVCYLDLLNKQLFCHEWNEIIRILGPNFKVHPFEQVVYKHEKY